MTGRPKESWSGAFVPLLPPVKEEVVGDSSVKEVGSRNTHVAVGAPDGSRIKGK